MRPITDFDTLIKYNTFIELYVYDYSFGYSSMFMDLDFTNKETFLKDINNYIIYNTSTVNSLLLNASNGKRHLVEFSINYHDLTEYSYYMVIHVYYREEHSSVTKRTTAILFANKILPYGESNYFIKGNIYNKDICKEINKSFEDYEMVYYYLKNLINKESYGVNLGQFLLHGYSSSPNIPLELFFNGDIYKFISPGRRNFRLSSEPSIYGIPEIIIDLDILSASEYAESII